MAYAIMRCEKLSSFGSVGGSLKHCFRERETLNADASKTEHNTHFYAKSSDDAFRRLRERLDTQAKIRKNAVLCVEYVFTASNEFFETASSKERTNFFEKSLDWLKEKYGDENILVATVHEDEKTPHLSAFVVPIDERGKLNARGLIGNREQMSRDQDTFYEKVKDLGLERGVKGSKARHQTIQQYYAELKKTTADVELLRAEDLERKKTGFLKKETDSERLERLNLLVSHRTKAMRSKSHEYDKTRNNMLEKSRLAEVARFKAVEQEKKAHQLQEQASKVLDQSQLIEKQRQEIMILEQHSANFHKMQLELAKSKEENQKFKKSLELHQKILKLAKSFGVSSTQELEKALKVYSFFREEEKKRQEQERQKQKFENTKSKGFER